MLDFGSLQGRQNLIIMQKEYEIHYHANGREDSYFVNVDDNGNLTDHDIMYSVEEHLKSHLRKEEHAIPDDYRVISINPLIK